MRAFTTTAAAVWLAALGVVGTARADCIWGVDPATGAYTEICGALSGGGGSCHWGVDPATGQYVEVCG